MPVRKACRHDAKYGEIEVSLVGILRTQNTRSSTRTDSTMRLTESDEGLRNEGRKPMDEGKKRKVRTGRGI